MFKLNFLSISIVHKTCTSQLVPHLYLLSHFSSLKPYVSSSIPDHVVQTSDPTSQLVDGQMLKVSTRPIDHKTNSVTLAPHMLHI